MGPWACSWGVERGTGDLTKDRQWRFREPQLGVELRWGRSSATSLACFHRIGVGEDKNMKTTNNFCWGEMKAAGVEDRSRPWLGWWPRPSRGEAIYRSCYNFTIHRLKKSTMCTLVAWIRPNTYSDVLPWSNLDVMLFGCITTVQLVCNGSRPPRGLLCAVWPGWHLYAHPESERLGDISCITR